MMSVEGRGVNASVLEKDIGTMNGVIHVIDRQLKQKEKIHGCEFTFAFFALARTLLLCSLLLRSCTLCSWALVLFALAFF